MSINLKESLESPRMMTPEQRAALSKRIADAATETPFSHEDWVLTKAEEQSIADGNVTPALSAKARRNELLSEMLVAVATVPDSEL